MSVSAKPQPHTHDAFLRPSASLFFAPVGDGVRRRRGTDAGRLVIAVIGLLLLGLLLTAREGFQASITEAVHPPSPGWSWVFTSLWFICSFGTISLIVLMALVGRRMEVLRDGMVGAAFALGVTFVFQSLFGATASFPSDTASDLHGVNLGFPVPVLATVAALTFVALPYFSRGIQRLLEIVIGLAFLSGLVHGAGLPFSLLGSIVVGWGAAAAVRLIFGSTTGLPSASDVGILVSSLGLDVTDVVPSAHQNWGLARYDAVGEQGASIQISLYGRDAQQSQLFAKLYRSVFFRNDSAPFSFTRAQQIDHECYMTILASNAVPNHTSTVVESGMVGPEKDGLVVTKRPRGLALAKLKGDDKSVSDAALRSLCAVIKMLHSQGLAHQAINLNRLYVDGDDGGLSDFERAQNFGDAEACSRDIAAAITSMAIVVGAQRSTDAAISVFGPTALTDALGFLQDAALPAELASELRKDHNKALLKELRQAGAKAANVEEPKLTEIRRVSWTNLILAVGTLIGAWALIGVFLHVAQSFSTIKQADIVWVIITAVVAQVAYLGSALSTMGSILSPVPYFPVTVLELSNTFSGLALGTPAVLAARIRFFQKHGVDTSIAVSSGVLVSTASWIVKGGLFLISLPFALGAMHLATLSGSSGGNDGQRYLEYAVILIVGVGGVVAVIFAVPRWRKLVKAQLVPRLKEVVVHFKALIHRPMKLTEIFGGMFIAQIVIAFALGSSVHAFGYSLSLPVLIVVLTLGSMLGGVSPVPGGMGVVEAGMILGLKAAGLPSDVAVSAVFVQRLFTAYLPPIAGWFALMWLRRKEYL